MASIAPINTAASLETVLPGFSTASGSAMDAVNNLLKGLPSVDSTRNANAYFGVGSGMPSSDFVRNRGYDLFNQQGEQRKQTGIQDLLSILGGYSGTVTPSASQELGAQTSRYGVDVGAGTSAAGLAEQARQFNLSQQQQAEQFGRNLGYNYADLNQRGQLGQEGIANNSLNTLLQFLS